LQAAEAAAAVGVVGVEQAAAEAAEAEEAEEAVAAEAVAEAEEPEAEAEMRGVAKGLAVEVGVAKAQAARVVLRTSRVLSPPAAPRGLAPVPAGAAAGKTGPRPAPRLGAWAGPRAQRWGLGLAAQRSRGG
jgi:hypothetical protein